MGRVEEEIKTYDQVLQRFDALDEADVHVVVAKAAINKAKTLFQLDLLEESVKAYSWVIERFADSSDARLQARAAKAATERRIVLGVST
jgi:hypothetical protein